MTASPALAPDQPQLRKGMQRLYLLTVILFLSYLCVALSLPVVPLMVTQDLGLGNGWAGLAVGIVFLATVFSRGHAGHFTDRRGPKTAARTGLLAYAAGAFICLLAGLIASPWTAYLVLALGRLAIGIGESLVAVAMIGWGIGSVGPERSGRVIALLGAALYGGFILGGPVGIAVYDAAGFSGAMVLATVLPLLGIAAIQPIADVPTHPAEGGRPRFWSVLSQIRGHGAIILLQGIGFAAIGAFFALAFLDRGWAGAGYGLSLFGAGFVLVRFAFGGLPDRLGGLPVALVSLGVEAVGQALIWLAPAPPLAFLGAFMTGLGCSLIFPGMGRDVVARVPPHLRGTALGGFSAFQDLAYGLTGPLAGILADRAGYGSVFFTGTVAALAGFVVALRMLLAERRG